MTFPVVITTDNGQFAASLMGNPQASAVGATRDEAVAALKAELQQRLTAGEIISLDVSSGGVSQLAGKYADDPTLRDICDEAYQNRNDELVE